MLMQTDGFARIRVSHRGKRTSVSLDDVLFDALARRVGSEREAVTWIRSAVLEVERLAGSGSKLVSVRNAGLSRLVQRMALDHVLNGVAQNAPEPSRPAVEPPSGAVPPALSTGSVDKSAPPASEVSQDGGASGKGERVAWERLETA